MKDFFYYTLIILVISLIIMRPECLKEYSTSPLGKILFLVVVVSTAIRYKMLSFLVLILFISLSYDMKTVEGMSNIDTFRKEKCKNNKLINPKDLSNVKFKNKKCNPCDETCKFTLTTSNEQLRLKDAVTPKNSKDSFIVKESIKQDDHVEPFETFLGKSTPFEGFLN